nr:hypothetical protein [Tanacetum cinerariifolium]
MGKRCGETKGYPRGVLVLSGLIRVWKSRTCDPVLWGADGNGMGTGAEVQKEPHHDIRPTLQRLPFYCTHADAVPDPTPKEFAVNNPSAKVIAKDEASQKQKASTSESDDDDACYEIPIVTPIRSAAVIPPSRNQSSRGKGIMTDADAAAALSVGASHQRVSFGPAPFFRELSEDANHRDFFPFSPGPCYATYPKGDIAGNYEFTREEWDAPHQPTLKVLTNEVFKDPFVCKTVVDQFSTPGEMVWIDALSSEQLTAKISVLYYLMMSHGGYSSGFCILLSEPVLGLLWKLLASDEFSRVYAELLSLAASVGFERGFSMHHTKEDFAAILNKNFQFVPGAQDRLAEASPWDACVSPPITKESTVTLAYTSLELLSNTVPSSSVAALEPNDEWGVSHVVDNVTELTVTGSECASSGPGDVVVAISAGEKGDGYVSYSIIEEVVAPPSKA